MVVLYVSGFVIAMGLAGVLSKVLTQLLFWALPTLSIALAEKVEDGSYPKS
ncbi:hypothetical protein [Mycolicibacterium sp. YH-1]|uniref:hypothetical protein n=1 Tax=Mycolicibacterium sp. YH-1 TaxID=2908837 RepID=UPI001F4C0F6E|nr:hypothetical protein [Mycolicibacterium sp. YH-1]UNB54433.1 hypothetical protein L0M16_08975 [Mycolicibacterium sp. YH-1]